MWLLGQCHSAPSPRRSSGCQESQTCRIPSPRAQTCRSASATSDRSPASHPTAWDPKREGGEAGTQSAGRAPRRDPLHFQLPRSKGDKRKGSGTWPRTPTRTLSASADFCASCSRWRPRRRHSSAVVSAAISSAAAPRAISRPYHHLNLAPLVSPAAQAQGSRLQKYRVFPPHPPLLDGAECCSCSVRPVPAQVLMSNHSSTRERYPAPQDSKMGPLACAMSFRVK